MDRYIHKCQKIGYIDPYNVLKHKFKDAISLQSSELPDLDYENIYSYLIKFEIYTNKTLNAYKSLESYILLPTLRN